LHFGAIGDFAIRVVRLTSWGTSITNRIRQRCARPGQRCAIEIRMELRDSPPCRVLPRMTQPTDRRIDKLVKLLVKNATVMVPGAKLADEIGVPRHTIYFWVNKLRELGVDVRGIQNNGFQLRKLPDILLPSLIRPELGDQQIGHRIKHYFRTGSTNDVALSLVLEGAPHGMVVVAEEQAAGRGRFGRSWYSEKASGIYTSLILRPALAPAAAPILTLMAGLAVHDAVTEATGLPADIRWPNDLLINGKKVCGILTEMSADMDRIHAVVLGLGINVNHRQMPEELAAIGTSLRMEGGKNYSRAGLFIGLLQKLEYYYRMLMDDGNTAITERWPTASTYARGKRIRVAMRSGEFLATTLGLDPTGALRIRRDDGQEDKLLSGEIVEVK
jgi:BirA family biotin operon repressor/biotin-[acetyl-CoA-carboxylase] ligase